jgi:hypothetical protein
MCCNASLPLTASGFPGSGVTDAVLGEIDRGEGLKVVDMAGGFAVKDSWSAKTLFCPFV